MEINPVKGTHDIVGDEACTYQEIESILREVAEVYGYDEFRTPIIEHSELFTRSVGESSDIVRKEMYTFLDKGNRSITLRPEVTASVIRAIVNKKLYASQDLPIKAFYLGPTFRYERPQAGRYRQFSQFGVEAVGLDSHLVDVEVIALGYRSLQALGFNSITLKINTLGDDESRTRYREALREYFTSHIHTMCGDCGERLKLNPLRILDCKVAEDQAIIRGAPRIHEFLSEKSKERFNLIINSLDSLGIKFELDESLVRGLDYYSETVFEYHFISSKGKSLGALGAGGHYSNLVEELGGPKFEGIGLSFGVERLAQVLIEEKIMPAWFATVDFYVMPVEDVELEKVYAIAELLRKLGYRTDVAYERKPLKTLFKKAERRNAYFAVIVGKDELAKNALTIKNMQTQEQSTVSIADLEAVAETLFAEVDDQQEGDEE